MHLGVLLRKSQCLEYSNFIVYYASRNDSGTIKKWNWLQLPSRVSPDRSTTAAHSSLVTASKPKYHNVHFDVDKSLSGNSLVNGTKSLSNISQSFLETRFPALSVSKVAAADSRSQEPSYAAHRWWARRPPSLMRSILIAAAMDGNASERDFWDYYSCEAPLLEGLQVHDPFMGAGTTLVEASRLGAAVSGTDIDPTAELIVSHSLEPAQESELADVAQELISFLRQHFSILYPADDGEPLHSFWLAMVKCPQCQVSGPLYRSLILARDCGKSGAVVRDEEVTAFDPETFELRHLNSPSWKDFQGSKRRWSLDHATFSSSKYECHACGHRSSHRDLQTGRVPRRLIAIERTPVGARRKLLPPGRQDHEAIELADKLLINPPVPLRLPDVEFNRKRRDPRPRSFGITTIRDLFTSRQLLVLGAAYAWVQSQNMNESVQRAMRLVLSNSLVTNNRLCSYATDYGRLSPLFSIRGFSVPALPVELNPLHSSGGRGTIQQCLNRILRSTRTSARRSTWNVDEKTIEKTFFGFRRHAPHVDVRCSSAADAKIDHAIDLLVFDPPYYDYIIYDELTEPFRAWDPSLTINGETLQSASWREAGEFGSRLADCLRPALKARKGRYPVAFTYHSSKPTAWEEIGLTLDLLDVRITSLWPIRSDGHMGVHSRSGSCEWDVVVVCRPAGETRPATIPSQSDLWHSHFGEFRVGAADLTSFNLAFTMAAERFGKLHDENGQSIQSGGRNG